MWFPIRAIGIYTNAATSFVPTNTTSRTVDGELLDPERGVQYEAGLKMSALDKALEGSVAVYQLTKDHVAMADPNNPGFNINGGKQRSKGIELDMTANLPFGLSLIGNMAWTQTEILESDALPVGERLENVPSRSGSIWGMYTIPQGALRDLSFGCGVFAESDKNGYNALANTPNTFVLPGYARVDAAMAYKFKLPHGQLINARLNVLNVFDTTYYESSFASTRVFPGDPRTATLTLGATF
jgi:iron complex outermembrane receptor protein